VGKSTFIEALGLVSNCARPPGGGARQSIPLLPFQAALYWVTKPEWSFYRSVHEKAYIRPSPSSGTLGGVAEKTREVHVGVRGGRLRRGHWWKQWALAKAKPQSSGMTDMFVLDATAQCGRRFASH
jgi:LAO/AO transport system kinase